MWYAPGVTSKEEIAANANLSAIFEEYLRIEPFIEAYFENEPNLNEIAAFETLLYSDNEQAYFRYPSEVNAFFKSNE